MHIEIDASFIFPISIGKLVNLGERSINDAATIVSLMNYDLAKYLNEVPYPYKIDDALNFIKTSYKSYVI